MTSDLDGEREGTYEHENSLFGEPSPIFATLKVDGERLEGLMLDGATTMQAVYKTIVERQKHVAGRWEMARARAFLARHPETVLETSLPPESRLKGKAEGDRVRFTKYYLGTCSVTANTGASRFRVFERTDHRVEYSGVLNFTRDVIEGEWLIRKRGLLGRLRRPDRGRFVLRKRA
jgi:hypothetical protein